MSDIFISYKREEQATARKLANALESEGWTVWWDPKLRAGERFNDVIEKALNEVKVRHGDVVQTVGGVANT